jgi:hypothetical protein
MEVVGGWRMHNEFNNLYSSPNIIRLMKLTRIISVGHVTGVGAIRCACSWLENTKGSNFLEDLSIDGI